MMTMTQREETTTPPIRATTLGRLWDYFQQMFPPAVYVPAGVANFLAIYFALQSLAGQAPLHAGWRAVVGSATVVLFSLLMRVYDELKDADSDRRLASQGDPRYRDRVIVTGQVRVEDLVLLRRTVLVALVALNVGLGSVWAYGAFALTLGVVWLSSKWFFWPAIQKNLLLAFATHNPITLVIASYVVAVFVSAFGVEALSGTALLVVLGAWFPLAAWETSRKLRTPENETEYQTYSKLLGWKVAVWLPAGFILAASAAHLTVARMLGLSVFFQGAVVAATLLVFGACLRFRLAPSTATANLRPVVELYTLIVMVGLPLTLALQRGVSVS
jgi:hypothetical protein